MGNPHYNTWGGKNNSWGNKNRKNKESNNSGGNGNKVAKAVVAGVCLFVLANTGFGPIIETAENVMDVFDFQKEVVESTKSDTKSNTKSNKKSNKKGKDNFKSLKNDADISASDIADILDNLYEKLDSSGVNTKKTTVLTVKYSCFSSDEKFEKEILKKLSKYKNTVTFIAVNDENLSEEAMQYEYERVYSMLSRCSSSFSSEFNSALVNGMLNRPNVGSFTIAVTFEK